MHGKKQWATRTLALNASVGLAKHIHYALALFNGSTQKPLPDIPILGSPFSARQQPQVMEALPVQLQVGS